MKFNKRLIFAAVSLVAVLTLNVGLYIGLNKIRNEVNAYTGSSLPTTINLNDSTEQEIRSYYSSLNSLDASERQGTNLLKNLKPILSNNQKYYNYDSGDTVWKMYEITDRDWVKSPANEITNGTYNANTNTITNYQYRANNNDPYIHALYVNRNVNNQTRAWADHSQTNWGINREHIWAKSHGFQNEGAGGARGDPMHLWAANGYANNKHSNYFFAFVDKSRSYENCGSAYSYISNNYKGYSLNAGGNQSVFEPQDCDKGDIARAVFYMVARYNNYAGNDNTIDTNNPNLVLLNNLSENGVTGTSTPSKAYGMGLLSDLLAWNKLDPVDEYERHRNNILYKNFTNNRNPFIDFPSWADAIWGTADLDGTHYNSTISSTANPAVDPINSGTVSNTLSLSTNSVSLEVGGTADIYGSNANGNITWSVSNDSVISLNKTTSVNNELVTITALTSGSATITATNGGNNQTCSVTVNEPAINYGSLEHPLSISQVKQIIDDNNGVITEDKMYVTGIVSSNSAYNAQYSNYDHIWLQSEDGQTANAFDLYRCKLDQSIEGNFTEANSLVNYQVVAYGLAKKYNSTYELSPNNSNQENPVILSMTPYVAPVKTAQEQIEEKDTNTVLSYRYNKETTEGGVADTLNNAFIGVSGTTYVDWSNKTGGSGVVYAGQSAGGDNTSGAAVQLRTKNSTEGIVVTSNTASSVVSSITITWNGTTASGRTVNIYGRDTAYTSPAELFGNDKGTLIGSLSYDGNNLVTSVNITGSYSFIGLKSNSSALYLESIQISWGGSTTTYEYSDVSIRFGGLLSQELWNELDTENHIIEGFGVMITNYDLLEGDDIKDFYNYAVPIENDPDVDLQIVDYYMAENEMSVPPTQGDNYIWNLFYRITDYRKVYVAAAYIKTEDEYIFFKQATYSVKTLATDYIANRGYSSNVADGSLNNLANLPNE